MNRNDDDDPKAWVSTLKVVLSAAVIIGVIGFVLWYAEGLSLGSPALEQAIQEVRQSSSRGGTSSGSSDSWGIFKDSPIRK